ncbi:MAG: Hsp20/alpha crystallin family protein [Bacteroidetes bacterium]|nr:Hsp20/alpha crystallin family protein [Bacteroidota bacterium]
MPSFFSDFFDMERTFGTDFMEKDFFKSMPAANITEDINQFKVELAVPGMSKNDFHINVENDVLTISAEKKEEKSERDEKFTRKEFYYGSFERTFTLPNSVAGEKIEGKYENGILKLVIPKKEEAKKKLVKEIKVS